MKRKLFINTLLLFHAIMVLSSCEGILQPFDSTSSTDSNYYINTFEGVIKGKPDSFVIKEQGKLNAIKKAYQLTDFRFTPRDTFEFNYGYYYPNIEYTGVPYSSTKELGTSVGGAVSFYTFATAIRNPRSKLYTERINEPPYHGSNCRAYYGTVCSSLVSYALGLKPGFGSYDFVDSEMMEDIGYLVPEDVVVADVLWRDTHVAIITDISYSKDGRVKSVEVSEAIHSGCRRIRYNRERFEKIMQNDFEKVIRYKFIENNIEYDSCPEIVPVAGESFTPIIYNESICVDKGDRSNYLIKEDVTINVYNQYDSLIVYKDGHVYDVYGFKDILSDIVLSNLPYGKYEAYLWNNNHYEKTSWIVIDYGVSYSMNDQMIYVKSENSTPVYVKLCSMSGSRGNSTNKLFNRAITKEEQTSGHIIVPTDKYLDDKHSYVQVKFQTEYGIASTLPIKAIN